MRIALISASVLALGACSANANGQEAAAAVPGETIQRGYSVDDFNSISLAGSQNVVVTVGGARSVRATGDARTLDQLEITVEDGALRIGQKNSGWDRRMIRSLPEATIYVSVPSLASAAIGGSGDMHIDRVDGEEFSGSVGGSGDLEIKSLRAGSASFSLAGSGSIRAAGTVDDTDVSVAGSGDIDLASLQAYNASVSIVGSGDVRANARRTAAISITGSGDAIISGGARCTVNTMGSGGARCG